MASIATLTTMHRQSPTAAIGSTPARTSDAIPTIHAVIAVSSASSHAAGPEMSPMLFAPP